MYTGASCGTLISPRNHYVAYGACSWESWAFTTLGTPRFGRLCPSRTVQHTLKMPLVFFTLRRVLRQAWCLHLTVKSPPDPLWTPSASPIDPLRTTNSKRGFLLRVTFKVLVVPVRRFLSFGRCSPDALVACPVWGLVDEVHSKI
eukprot:7179546-Pyramimonas_sp.AAC.2